MLRATIVASALSGALMVASPVHAAGDNDGGAAAAESLFQEGRKLMDAKRYGEACPKFAASQKMAPAIGTLLNLADCYEKNNQLASAWARFHEAIALAQRLGRANREQTAKERADKIEPRLIKLTIFSRSSVVDVKLDGNAIDPAVLGTPIPVDEGKHTIEATAKGKKTYVKTFDVTDKSKSPTVEIPVLEDDGGKAAVTTVVAPTTATAPSETGEKFTPPPSEEPKSTWSGRKTLGIIVGSLGVVGLGVGTYYGLKAKNTWKQTLDQCDADLRCEDAGLDLGASAKRYGNFSTIGFAAGGVLLAGGVVLFITAPSGKKVGVSGVQRIGVGPGTLTLGGTF